MIVQLEEEKLRLEAEVEVLRRLLVTMSGQTTEIESQLFLFQRKLVDVIRDHTRGAPD